MKATQNHIILFVLIALVNFYSLDLMAVSARAQWMDASRMRVRLHPGTSINKDIHQFSLIDSSQILTSKGVIPLPLISSDGIFALLDTSHIPASEVEYLITQPVKVTLSDSQQHVLDSTAIQYAGLLDQNFFYEGDDLGANCSRSKCLLKLWAPTAQKVNVRLFKTATQDFEQGQVLPAVREKDGIWSLQLPITAKNNYFVYEVQLYQPLTDKIETHIVTDPYSRSLSLNGTRTQIVDMTSPESQPANWTTFSKPLMRSFKDAVIYELHVRDFSANDESLDSSLRGTYLAFAANSRGTQHLRDLADAGMTHVHILPFNDFGSVNEIKEEWQDPAFTFTRNLEEPQNQIGKVRDQDNYNWGYDPVHYLSAEGSYAADGQGINRVREARTMIQALNNLGLRVVQDVVFNHTFENALDRYSVFDKIVPLYYYRVDDNGRAYSTSCCPDTASEHRMMEKLMVDTVLHWAKNYKMDGFRFDLMSFHSRATILKIRDEVRALTLSRDGVDGSKILIYGEGWTFGSFYDRHPDESMTHENSFGSGIGFFNDRLRDAVRGGTTNSNEKSDQGFATGLYFDFNHEPANRNTPTDAPSQRGKLLHLGDVVKVGLAGNLRDLSFKDHLGNTITGYSLRYRGAPVAFGAQAIESINYVSAHDGYGVWDAIQAKAPFNSYGRQPATASLEERQRMAQLILAFPLLGQGIPFIESGSELLRSKNGDQDSYNSGDFFNRIDWQGQENYWGAALPPAWKNINDWAFWQPRLLAPELQVSSDLISKTREYFKALLRVRQSSDLFKMNTPGEIAAHLKFIDNDTKAEPGLIAMLLYSKDENLLVFFNASKDNRTFNHELLKKPWIVHPLLNSEVDAALADVDLNSSLGWVRLPGRSTVVLQLKNHEIKRR